jgi:hypothetical protein
MSGTMHPGGANGRRGDVFEPSASGRWPKNAVLSCALACEGDRHSPGCPRRMLDEMSGTSTNGGQKRTATGSGRLTLEGGRLDELPTAFAGDTGGASRFFMGSGSVGVAAISEGAQFVGIERDDSHFDVAQARVMAAVGSPEHAAASNAKAPVGAQLGLL